MTSGLMLGKRGLIMGVANDHSIAWGIAKAIADEGAELAFTYQGEALGKRVEPLARSLGSEVLIPCDVEDLDSIDAAFSLVASIWGTLDFVVHCIGFSDRNELKGRYADTSRENFVRTMVISAFSFTEVAKRAAALMPSGGAMLTLTFGGSERVVPNYNVMGVAKAALEASVRYLAADFGPDNIRVNAISAGPVRTLAGAGVTDARFHVQFPTRSCASQTKRHYREYRWLRALPALKLVGRRDRGGAFRRCRLQYHLHAAAERLEVLTSREATGDPC